MNRGTKHLLDALGPKLGKHISPARYDQLRALAMMSYEPLDLLSEIRLSDLSADTIANLLDGQETRLEATPYHCPQCNALLVCAFGRMICRACHYSTPVHEMFNGRGRSLGKNSDGVSDGVSDDANARKVARFEAACMRPIKAPADGAKTRPKRAQ